MISIMNQNSPDIALRALFDAQHRASRQHMAVPLALRRDRLLRVRRLLDEHGPAMAAAVEADFGVRSPQLTDIADVLLLRSLLAHTLKSLPRWLKPEKVATPLHLLPSRAYLQRQPLGVVGVVAPWNYPLQLSLAPAITALAAGNRVMLKPSELTPLTSALLGELVPQYFAEDEFCVVQGDAALASAFVSLPFDHLVFTGSTQTGRKVAQAAAANLTPTTLELGGKSPCILDASVDLEAAAIKIAHGKLLNAGQTCIAPDYMLVPRGMEAAFADAFSRAVRRLFPVTQGNPDYASIINARQHDRLKGLLDDAQRQGARLAPVNPPAGPDTGHLARQMLPVLVFDTQPGMQLIQEEIFGPVLPVLAYDSLDQAIAYINERPRPLALYWFGRDTAAREQVLNGTVSGGVCINDTLMHIAHDNLPFGGVGESGWGAYHSVAGFLRFCQQKPVLISSRWARGDLLYPPYGPRFQTAMRWIKWLF
jgi:coniferyl-aldehyde dehydrogenase